LQSPENKERLKQVQHNEENVGDAMFGHLSWWRWIIGVYEKAGGRLQRNL